MADRTPQTVPLPTGFYPYRPSSLSSRPSASNDTLPPPPPPASQSPAFAFGYSYNSAHVSSATYQHHESIIPTPLTDAKQTPTTNSGVTSCWTCDACEITLDSERALKSHRKSHVKCSDCSFEGAPKVVKAHYQAIHGKFSGSGFKTVTVAVPGCRVQRFRICVGNRPEDIQKWIAERKKRFPRQSRSNGEADKMVNDTSYGHDKSQTEIGKAKDSGMSSLLAGYGSSSESEAENTTKRKEGEERPKIPTVAVTATNTASTSTENSTSTIKPATKSRPCRYFMRNGSCRNGDACRFSHDISPQQLSINTDRKRKRGKATSSDTLLRKLLLNDMEREASFALQLLGYINDCDFFEAEKSGNA